LNRIKETTPVDFDTISTIETYNEIVDAFIKSRFNLENFPDKYSLTDPFICNIYNIMSALSYAVSPNMCRALPGYTGSANSRKVDKVVRIDRNSKHRIYTGLYVNPGEVVKITHNNRM
jgi:hypothetical protein